MNFNAWHPKTLIDRFNWIMTFMIACTRGGKKEHGTVASALVVLMQKRFDKLRVTVMQAYTRGPIPLRVRRPGASRQIQTEPDPRPIPEYILPHCFGWALRMLPGTEIGLVQSRFKHLLTDPEMHALVATNRAVGRALRSLCHILGLKQPEYLRLPRPRRRKAADESSRKAADALSPKPPADPSRASTPRRPHPPRPSPFPVAPPLPTPDQQKRAFREMFIDHREPQRLSIFTPILWTYVHPRE